MISRHLFVLFAVLGGMGILCAQEADEHMKEELGVNDITAPNIAQILKDFGVMRPIPLDLISSNDRGAVYDNRLQTSFHFGSLVADGFMLTVAERAQDVEDVGRALIRESVSLGVSDRLTKRSKVLFEYCGKGNWQGMRTELIRTQGDVEKSMVDLHDEQIAHMISLGGWMRGFQLAANSTAQSYSEEKAKVLGQADVMDYYIDRLETLHPRLKKTQFVSALTAKLKELRTLATGPDGKVPTAEEVKKMRDVANQLEEIALGPVDSEGNILPKTPAPSQTPNP